MTDIDRLTQARKELDEWEVRVLGACDSSYRESKIQQHLDAVRHHIAEQIAEYVDDQGPVI